MPCRQFSKQGQYKLGDSYTRVQERPLLCCLSDEIVVVSSTPIPFTYNIPSAQQLFRILILIVVQVNLELIQDNTINIFINAKLVEQSLYRYLLGIILYNAQQYSPNRAIIQHIYTTPLVAIKVSYYQHLYLALYKARIVSSFGTYTRVQKHLLLVLSI